MGKHYEKKLQQLDDIMKKAKKAQKEAVIECAHQKGNGKIKIKIINSQGDCRCPRCETEYNINPVSKRNAEEAYTVLHNMIQQARSFCDPEKESAKIRLLGEMDYNLSEFLEVYDRMLNAFSKKGGGKKGGKNNKHGNDNLSRGKRELSFL